MNCQPTLANAPRHEPDPQGAEEDEHRAVERPLLQPILYDETERKTHHGDQRQGERGADQRRDKSP